MTDPFQDRQPGEHQPERGGGPGYLGVVLFLLGIPPLLFGLSFSLLSISAGSPVPMLFAIFAFAVGAALMIAARNAGPSLHAAEPDGRPTHATAGRPPLTPFRISFVAIGGLVLSFAGGCTLLFGQTAWNYEMWDALLLFGGVPIAAGLLILLLALRWRRGDGGGARNGEEEPND